MKPFTETELPSLFNEWMRRFTEEPERFQAEFKTVGLFLAEQNAGAVPSYGDSCVAYLDKMRVEAADNAKAAVELQRLLNELGVLDVGFSRRVAKRKTKPLRSRGTNKSKRK